MKEGLILETEEDEAKLIFGLLGAAATMGLLLYITIGDKIKHDVDNVLDTNTSYKRNEKHGNLSPNYDPETNIYTFKKNA